MKDLYISVGLRSDKRQASLLVYATLRTAGVTLREFLDSAYNLGLAFNGVLDMVNNQLKVKFEFHEDLSLPEARQQLIRLCLVQLGVNDVSVGEFETIIRNEFKEDKK